MARSRLSIIFIIFCAVGIGVFWGLRLQHQSAELARKKAAEPFPKIKVLSYSGLLSPKFLSDFKKRYEIEVDLREVENPERLWELFETSFAPDAEDYDIITLFSYQVPLAAQLDRIKKIDRSLIANLQAVSPDFRDIPGQDFFQDVVPLLWGVVGLAYSEDVKNPPDSWASALGGSKQKLKLPSSTTLLWKLSAITSSNKDLEKRMAGVFSKVALAKDFLSARTLFEEKEKSQLIAINHGEMAFSPFSGADWKFVLPKDGAPLWILTFALSSESKNLDKAHDFLNFTLERESALELTGFTRQASTHRELESELIDKRLKPSYFRQISLSELEIPKDFNRARELREIINKTTASER